MSDAPRHQPTAAERIALDRESRQADLMEAWKASPDPMSIGMVMDIEGGLILHSAMASYVGAVDVAAIITAHASCERDLLGRVAHWKELGEPEPKKGFEKWGLGSLIGFLGFRLPAPLVEGLTQLNDRRRNLYHYGHADGETGVRETTRRYVQSRGEAAVHEAYQRRHHTYADPGQLLEFATAELLREQALESIRTAFITRAWASGQKRPIVPGPAAVFKR